MHRSSRQTERIELTPKRKEWEFSDFSIKFKIITDNSLKTRKHICTIPLRRQVCTYNFLVNNKEVSRCCTCLCLRATPRLLLFLLHWILSPWHFTVWPEYFVMSWLPDFWNGWINHSVSVGKGVHRVVGEFVLVWLLSVWEFLAKALRQAIFGWLFHLLFFFKRNISVYVMKTFVSQQHFARLCLILSF